VNNFEKKILSKNEKAIASAKAKARVEKMTATAAQLKSNVESFSRGVAGLVTFPFTAAKKAVDAIKTNIESSNAKKQAEKQYQSTCQQQYDSYIALADQTMSQIGTYEHYTTKEGEKVTVVYTENGPITKIEYPHDYPVISCVQYEGIINEKMDGFEQLVYAKVKSQVETNPYYNRLSGFIQTPHGFLNVAPYKKYPNQLFNNLNSTFDKAYETAVAMEQEKKEAQFQEDCRSTHESFMNLVDKGARLVGTIQSQSTENGDNLTIVYTQNGPIVKTDLQHEHPVVSHIRYEGLLIKEVDGANQFVYYNIARKEEGDKAPNTFSYVGFVEHASDEITNNFSQHPETFFNELEMSFKQACKSANTTQAPEA
jgi:hypothetical protein